MEDGGWRVRVLEGVGWRVGGSEVTWAARRNMSVRESLSASCGAAAGGAVGARRSRSLCPSRCADRSKAVNLRGTASEFLGMLQSESPSERERERERERESERVQRERARSETAGGRDALAPASERASEI